MANPCAYNSIGSPYPYPDGFETALPLNTNSPSADNNAGLVNVILGSVTFTASPSSCPIANIVVLGTEPSGPIPYSESATNSAAILGNYETNAVTFEWSLYVARCTNIFLYAVTPNSAKGGITSAKICTCGQETITLVSSGTLELLY